MLINSLVFRALSVRSTTLRTLQARLVSALTSLEASLKDTLDSHDSEMLLWTLWIGAMATAEPEWYVPHIVQLAQRLALNAWPETRALLKGFVWNPHLENHACWELCKLSGLLLQDNVQ
jgi:hypothetical protein